MKRIISCGVILLAGFLSSFNSPPVNSLPIGSAMPKASLSMMDVSGKMVSLTEAKKENGLLVMFSCNTCPYVIKNQGRTSAICQYAAEKKIGVILLNANEGDRDGGNSFADMQGYDKDQHYQWFYALDKGSELANAFGASRTPECFLFDKSDKLVYHGAIDDSPGYTEGVKRQHLKEAINEMLEGKEVSVKETRSVGCTIRRS